LRSGRGGTDERHRCGQPRSGRAACPARPDARARWLHLAHRSASDAAFAVAPDPCPCAGLRAAGGMPDQPDHRPARADDRRQGDRVHRFAALRVASPARRAPPASGR
ncbi:MAG TPA: hypothetical protein DCQ80_19095, partial [Pseudomonas sp.]|nr:hypothetical protein [Pseudomonas sp.]